MSDSGNTIRDYCDKCEEFIETPHLHNTKYEKKLEEIVKQYQRERNPCRHLNTHYEGSLGEFCNTCGAPVD